jgi:serine/threonine protein kinase
VNHPNISTIYEVNSSGGQPFIVMEFVEGHTLDRHSAGRPMQAAEILDIAAQIVDALDAAHDKNIVHRDIKPANLMITPRGQVKVLDFGLAKIDSCANPSPGDNLTLQTQPGAVMGTVRYMSPEQALGREIDHRSDLFSLGVVLYEMAAGRPPFLGSNDIDTINQIINVEPEMIIRRNPQMPSGLQEIISRCLRKNPQDRYSSHRSLLADLRSTRTNSSESADFSKPREIEPGLYGRILSIFGMTSPYGLWEHTQLKLGLLLPLIVLLLGWKFQTWTPGRWGLGVFFAGMLCACGSMIMRIVLLTIATFHKETFHLEVRRLSPWIRGIALCLTLALWAMAITIMDSHGLVAVALAIIGVLNGLVSLILEPWISDTAFPKAPSA